MSWQAYVDQSLVGTGNVDKAAIFNVEGTSVWASSAGFTTRVMSEEIQTVTPEEIKQVIASYSDTGETKSIQMKGFHIGGLKYMTVKTDDRSVYGRKGKEGVMCVKTQQAILVAHYPETVQPGNASIVVEKLGDYLIGVGY